jgi:hypothetical protein
VVCFSSNVVSVRSHDLSHAIVTCQHANVLWRRLYVRELLVQSSAATVPSFVLDPHTALRTLYSHAVTARWDAVFFNRRPLAFRKNSRTSAFRAKEEDKQVTSKTLVVSWPTFRSENGCNTFRRNVDELESDYSTSHPRTQNTFPSANVYLLLWVPKFRTLTDKRVDLQFFKYMHIRRAKNSEVNGIKDSMK